MRCLASLVLALLALEAALALAPALTPQEKVAVCPDTSSETISSEETLLNCKSDQDCPQDTKCCPNSSSSRFCMAPVMVPAPKAGCCSPAQDSMTSAPRLESKECFRDEDCENNKKCCSNMCAMRCMEPTAG